MFSNAQYACLPGKRCTVRILLGTCLALLYLYVYAVVVIAAFSKLTAILISVIGKDS